MTDVAVIGAGFAGLSAATALAEDGARVAVFEARPALGGRATAFRDRATGERIDNGQHALAGCYDETLRFLRRIGSVSGLHRPSALRVPMVDEAGRSTVLSLPPLAAPLHLLAGVLAWDALTAGDRLSMLRIAGALRAATAAGSPQGVDPATITVREWLVRHRQPARLCALLWEPLALAALNQSIDHAAADMFIAVVGRMFSPPAESASLLLPAVPLDDLYAAPARAFLAAAGSSVATGATARVVFDRSRVAGVQVRGEQVPCSRVIVAVPWHALQAAVPDPPPALESIVSGAAAMESSPIVTVNVWFDAPVLDEMLLGLPGRTFQWAFDKRRLAGATQTHVSLVSSGAHAICSRTNHELTSIAVADLQGAVPAARKAAVRHVSVVRERRATFSLAPGAPPRPPTGTAVPGLLLAGDWIATGLPATIESAVASGHAAARAARGAPG